MTDINYNFTKAEAATISAAYRAIAHLCDCTNWTDARQWADAEKAERRETTERGGSTEARAMIVKAWAEGLANPDKPARELFIIRPGYLSALLLGVRHAVERAGHDYNGPMVAEARELAAAAVAVVEARSARITDQIRAR